MLILVGVIFVLLLVVSHLLYLCNAIEEKNTLLHKGISERNRENIELIRIINRRCKCQQKNK